MSWDDLRERASARADGVSVAAVQAALEAVRDRAADSGDEASDGESVEASREGVDSHEGTEIGRESIDPPDRPDPARIVADADVLAADLLVGGDAREAMDILRAHEWLELLASDALLDDAAAVIAEFAEESLAAAWREEVTARRVAVDQPPGDHPGLASAAAGGAAHLLTFDEGLASAGGNLSLQAHLRISVRTPHAFVTLFDPERLYPEVVGGEYPGPDRDPLS